MSSIEELVKYCHKVYEKGFVSATDGNLSIRLSDKLIAITRSGINKGEVKEDDIVITDLEGNKLEGFGQPSSEIKIHLLAYNERHDINAVVHCHPIYSTAIATANMDLTKPIFPEVVLTIGPVPLCKYGTPSTEELPNSMKPYIKDSWVMLLQNHGAVSFGRDISNAFYNLEKIEHSAKILILTRILGGETALSSEQVKKLRGISEQAFGINSNSSSNNKHLQNFTEIIEERLRARAGNPKFTNTNFGRNFKTDLQNSSLNNIISKLIN